MRTNLAAVVWLLHYLAPSVTLLCFAGIQVLALCTSLHAAPRRALKRSIHWMIIFSWSLVLATSLAKCLAYILHSKVITGSTADTTFYILASFCVDILIALNLFNEREGSFLHYLGAALAGFLLETALMVTIRVDHSNPSCAVGFTLEFVKLIALLTFSILCFFIVRSVTKRETGLLPESEPLLNGQITGNGDYETVYNCLEGQESDSTNNNEVTKRSDDDDSEDDEEREIKALQKERLQQSGSWLAYLLDFKIFVPILWPGGDRKVQLCLVVVGLVLVAERFLNVLVPRQLGIIFDHVAAYGDTGVFPWKAVGLYMLYSYLDSACGVYILEDLADLPISQFAQKRIAEAAFSHIMQLSMHFHTNKSSNELCKAIDQGQSLKSLIEFTLFTAIPMFVDLIVAFCYIYSLFDIYMTFILAVAIIIYMHIGMKTAEMNISTRRKWNRASREEARMKAEAITNWQTVANFNQIKHECNRYNKCFDRYLACECSYFVWLHVGWSLLRLILLVARLSAFSLAIYQIVNGIIPPGNLVVLMTYWRTIEAPIQSMSHNVKRLGSMLTDAERLLQLLQTGSTVKEAPNAYPLDITRGEVVFRNVQFHYDSRRPILKDLSFTANPGRTIALVGETGGGKSTILKLLYRYYDVIGGGITIDGHDLRDVTLDSLRDSFGMVPQDPTLFNISIMENLRYARLDATDDDIKDACRAAAIHTRIEGFPDKYHSLVGERGVKLSGGELQRVSIARAILRKPRIVLLDEATSMIDAETEAVIQQALRRLTVDRTTFVVAHRLSTIQHADQILVVSNGSIVERGTHEELLRQNGKYVGLWSKQLSREIEQVGNTLDVDDD